jgi:hypothetical protein
VGQSDLGGLLRRFEQKKIPSRSLGTANNITHRIEQIVLSAVFDDGQTNRNYPLPLQPRPGWGDYGQTGEWLIMGQNPASAVEAARTLLKLLKK